MLIGTKKTIGTINRLALHLVIVILWDIHQPSILKAHVNFSLSLRMTKRLAMIRISEKLLDIFMQKASLALAFLVDIF
jgi:hypothetical protein